MSRTTKQGISPREASLRLPLVLAVAGSDSGGGAGMQADLRTIAALGCHGLSVLTAVTAQNSREVRAILPVPPSLVRAQFDAILDDMGADAVKIGMLATAANVREVAHALRRRGAAPAVLDPVLRATAGPALLASGALALVERLLFPLVTIVTPNIPEAEAILGRRIGGAGSRERAARDLIGRGARAVLLKGGHRPGPARDFFTDGVEELTLEVPRLPVRHTHGGGCVLSTAIACFLAGEYTLPEAVRRAKAFVTEAIRRSYPLGSGRGPVNPLGAARSRSPRRPACP